MEQDDFVKCCKKAIEAAQRQSTAIPDFRVWTEGDPTPEIFETTEKGINEMFEFVDWDYDFDCELFFNYANGAVSADHGVKYKDEHLYSY